MERLLAHMIKLKNILTEGKLNELDPGKSKKLVSKAIGDIKDAMFNFRHSNPLKMIAAKDKELKDQLDSMHNAIFDIERLLKSKGISEGKLNEAGSLDSDISNFLKTFRLTEIQNPFVYEVLKAHFDIEKRIIEPVQEMDDFLQDQWMNMTNGAKAQFARDVRVPEQVIKAWYKKLSEGKVTESVLRGQLAGDSALDMANHLRQYGVKKILKQPNDSVTYLQLTNKSKGNKVVAMLKKMFGIKAQIDNHMYSPTPAVKFDNDQIAESKLTEGKYDHMIGKAFKLPGRGNTSYKITKIEDNRFVHVLDDRQNSSMFDIKKVVKDNPGIDKKPKVKRTAWNKGTGDKNLISRREYAKILMGAMKDATSMGDQEATHDMAQSMIYDQSILARLVKDHPGKNSTQLTQQLQWDLEAAA